MERKEEQLDDAVNETPQELANQHAWTEAVNVLRRMFVFSTRLLLLSLGWRLMQVRLGMFLPQLWGS